MLDIGPGSYFMHELLDRTHILNVMLVESLSDHPSLAYDESWGRLVARARTALHELYQQVGAAHAEGLEPDPEEARGAGKPLRPWRKTASAGGLSAVSARSDERNPDERNPDDPDPDLER